MEQIHPNGFKETTTVPQQSDAKIVFFKFVMPQMAERP